MNTRKIHSLKLHPVVLAPQSIKLNELARRMIKTGAATAAILVDGRVAGIVTEHDIVEKAVSQSRHPDAIDASEVMSGPVLCVEMETEFDAAWKMANEQQASVVLVEASGGNVVGYLDREDLLGERLWETEVESRTLSSYINADSVGG